MYLIVFNNTTFISLLQYNNIYEKHVKVNKILFYNLKYNHFYKINHCTCKFTV